MNERDAFEQAYKNGYEAGVKEFAERLKGIYTNDRRYDRPTAHTLIIKLFDNIEKTAEELIIQITNDKNRKDKRK